MVENQFRDGNGAEQGIKVLELLQVLVKRKILIAAICCLTGLLSSAYSLTLPNIYAATTKVFPPQKEGAGLSAMLGQMGGIAGMAAGSAKGNESELYVSLLKSRSVGFAVIQRLDLAKTYKTKTYTKTWKRLDAAVKVQAGRDGIITLVAEDRDPRQAALLANTMTDELGRVMVRLNLSKAGSEMLFLGKRLDLVKRDLKQAEDDMKDFSQRHKIVQVDAQAEASVSGVARLKGDLAEKEVQLAVLRTSLSDENFEVKELLAAIKRLQHDLARMVGNGGGGEGIPAIGNVPGLGLEYARKLRELRTQEAIFEQLTKQYEMAKMNQAKDSSSLQILDEAVVPEEKSRPRRSTIVAMATVAAFICSIVLVFVLEHFEKMPDGKRKVIESLRDQALSFR